MPRERRATHDDTDVLVLAQQCSTPAELDVKFDALNPEIYPKFREMVQEVIDCGRRFYSSTTLVQVMRHHSMVSGGGGYRSDGGRVLHAVRLNDHISGYLARRWMLEHPQFHDFFETRRSPYLDHLYKARLAALAQTPPPPPAAAGAAPR